jgi:hypothetical protein
VVRFGAKTAENDQYRLKTHIFPCIFPVNREIAAETGSLGTGHTATFLTLVLHLVLMIEPTKNCRKIPKKTHS